MQHSFNKLFFPLSLAVAMSMYTSRIQIKICQVGVYVHGKMRPKKDGCRVSSWNGNLCQRFTKKQKQKTVQSCNQGTPLNLACNVGCPVLCSIQPECNFITWKWNRVSKNLVSVKTKFFCRWLQFFFSFYIFLTKVKSFWCLSKFIFWIEKWNKSWRVEHACW